VRVLHVVECYGGGVGRAVDTLVAVTPEIEHHLLYAGDFVPPADRWATAVRLPSGLAARVRATRVRADALAVDVVHAHSSWAGVYARARRSPVPVVYQPHCFSFVDPTLPPSRRATRWAAEAVLARHSAAVAVVSAQESWLARALGGHAAVQMVPNAPVVEISDAREAPSSRARRVATAGRICPQKAPDLFAQVVRECDRRGAGAEFVWIGDGDAAGRRALEEAGVRVTGWVSRAALQAELDESSVYLHTATYEGFPLSVLDAAARRIPMVLRAIPAFAGSGLTTVPADALPDRVGALLDDEREREAAVAEGARLVARMNGRSLAVAARRLYDRLAPAVARTA
jgi:glycosyltransferase involved in cell wall biosynthesis